MALAGAASANPFEDTPTPPEGGGTVEGNQSRRRNI